MSVTTKIPAEQLAEYFERFTKRFLRDGSPEAVDVEVLEPEWGDQRAVEGVRLLGITYDYKVNSLEFELEPGDHRVYSPQEVWTIEEDDGFVSAIEVVRPDSTREIVSVRRVGLRRLS
jgi:hypothetical protein